MNVALEGYDAVAYTGSGKAVRGSSAHTTDWNDKEWQFESEESARSFAADPDRFAPQFEGNCAFAMSLGKDVPGSPKHFVVRDGKMYLQSNPVAAMLFRLIPGRVGAATDNWRH